MEIQFYTVEEAAKILKAKISTVRTYCREGKIPAIKIGRGYRIAKADLAGWLKQQKKGLAFSSEGELRLIETEARYKGLFENASDAIVLFDVKGCLILANPKFYEQSGYTPEEIEGIHFAQFVHPEDLPLVTERFMARVAGEEVPSGYEIRCLRKNGQIVPLELNSSCFVKEGKPSGVQVILRDITERKRVDEAVRESRERYRSLFEDSPISLWEEDFSEVKTHIDGLRRKGIKEFRTYFDNHPEVVTHCAGMVKIIDVNQATLRLYQARSKKEFQGGLDRIFCKESYDGFKEQLIAITKGKTRFEIEAINQTLKGEKKLIFLRWSVVPGYEKELSEVIVSIIDITERKKAEESHRESEEMYRMLVEASPDAITVTDLEGNITYASEQMLKLFGYQSAKDLVGRSGLGLVERKERKKAQANIQKILEEGIRRGTRYSLVRADGTYFVGEVNGALVRDANGQPKAFIITTRDVSEPKR